MGLFSLKVPLAVFEGICKLALKEQLVVLWCVVMLDGKCGCVMVCVVTVPL